MDVSVTEREIVAGLRRLGLERGSVVIVHASLHSFGHVEGGAAVVANALVSVCGTVVVPSGTWDLTGVPAPPGTQRPNNAALVAADWPAFDAAVARAVPYARDLPVDRELGAVPEAIRRGSAHVRSDHPLFSFLAVGEHAERIVVAARLDWPLGPLEVVEELNGEVVLLGVDHTSNSAVHLAEQRLGRSRFYRYGKASPGVRMELPNIPGQSHRFDDLAPALAAATTETAIGACHARRIPIRDVLEAAERAIREDPGALLCADEDCRCYAALQQRRAWLGRTPL